MVTLLAALALAQPPVALWVDPARGDDRRSGATRAQAVRTLTEAWGRIPIRTPLGRSYRIRLTAGVYAPEAVPNYWESRWGSASARITIESADGPGAARLPSLNLFDVRWTSLVGLRVDATGGNVVHCERCDHVSILRSHIDGHGQAHEGLKANQSSHLTIEDSDISGAEENPIDFVAVQHAAIRRNRIHSAGEWCMYVKGGSAYIRVDGNEIFDCAGGGFTAGQGTGLEFMVAPWLRYEANQVVFANNVVHDTRGAGMGVNGGDGVVLAYNTLFRVGATSHVLEVVFGLRGCDGNVPECRSRLDAGGWGTLSREEEPIPNRNVSVLNNVFLNPAPYRSRWQQLAVYGPRTPGTASRIPSPARTDVGLRIRGNVIWNGPRGLPLGIEDGDQGCRPANRTCNERQLRAENEIDTLEPRLVDPSKGNFRPAAGGLLLRAKTYPLPKGIVVAVDRDGRPRQPSGPPGAYSGSSR